MYSDILYTVYNCDKQFLTSMESPMLRAMVDAAASNPKTETPKKEEMKVKVKDETVTVS